MLSKKFKEKKNFKIIAIFNNYNNILYNFINNLDPKFINWPKLINKKLYNMLRFKNSLTDFLKKNSLDKSFKKILLYI